MAGKLVSAIEWWKKKEKWTCSLICYDEVFSQIWLEPGKDLFFEVQPGRYCIGYTTLTSRASRIKGSFEPWKNIEPCPSKAEIKKGYKCSLCYHADLIYPCRICHGTECRSQSPVVQASCRRATAYVYIASFGMNKVKVGVAHETRIPLRWIEQGANLAKRIIIGNGMEVRRFEKAIHDSLDVFSGLKTEKKVDTLWQTQSTKEEIDAISKGEEEIIDRFPEFPFFQEPIYNLLAIYDLPILDRRPLKLEVKRNRQISGKILGVKGSLILLEIRDSPHFLNLSHLQGRKIELKKGDTFIVQTYLDRY